MLIDRTDNPDLLVQLLSVRETDVGALEEPARAIEIELEVAGKGRFTAFGVHLLSDNTHMVTSIGPLPASASKKASEITRLWAIGAFVVPFVDKTSEPS